ncbi:hypothetical protein A9320_25400 [Ruegeria sp. PBVC088]|nr:hypothetical protein A9320_25400 [Ruegeria sp. PBVC088]
MLLAFVSAQRITRNLTSLIRSIEARHQLGRQAADIPVLMIALLDAAMARMDENAAPQTKPVG